MKKALTSHFFNLSGIRYFILPVFLLSVLWIGGCRSKKAGEEKPTAMVSIMPFKFFVDQLTGGAVEVSVMVPPGASPATYSPAPGQIRELSDAQLYLQTGHLGFELAWMERLEAMNPQMKVVNLSEGLSLIKGEDQNHGDHVHVGGIDPHIWMSPKAVLQLLPALKEAVITTWPALADTVNLNYPRFVDEVRMRDQALQKVTDGLSRRQFMIFHPALTYLARDYGLEQLPIEFEGKEPSPGGLKRLIDQARDDDIRILFIQAEFDKRNAQLVSEETGARLVVINPLQYNWLDGMDQLARLLDEYLK